ncbi:uncharacterized protein LOC143461890 isoform X1 [Clavelina lepadiformis]|uniref:uncharacterized protein LOC143461890 isoform X1 n=1 Tax=Clavelina lepadiformis TaxID=159417 RepID=UPI00404154F7
MKNSKSKLRKLPVAHFDVTTPWFHRLLQYDVMTMKAGGGTLPLLREPGVDESTTDDDVFSLIEQLHLNDLNLSDVEREAVIEVIRRRQAAFSLSKQDLGKTNILTHSIDTGDVTPIRQHPRRMSEENKRKVEMRIVLDGVEWNGALAYLDDIIMYARTFQDHLHNLDDVLSRLIGMGNGKWTVV